MRASATSAERRLARRPWSRCPRTLARLLIDGLDAVADHALVEFQLFLTRTAHADAPLLSIEVSPPAFQTRAEVLQLRQLYLQLTLVAARALREDVEDQPGAIEHAALEFGLEVPFLAGGECVVEQDESRFVGQHGGLNLFKLAGCLQKGWVRVAFREPVMKSTGCDAGGDRQFFEFGWVFPSHSLNL